MRYTIGQLAEIIDGDRGKNYPTINEFFDEGYCLFLNTGNVTENGFSFESNQFISKDKDLALRKGRLQRGDIVYTTRGTVGNAAFFSSSVPFDNIRINSGMVILRCNSEIIDTCYLYQLLKSKYYRSYFKSFCTGSAQPQLPIKNFSNIPIEIPAKDKQRKIADYLMTYDSLIENNQRQIKLLEEAAQRLYKEWFVDLRYPGHENVPVVDGVPEGWTKCTLDDVIEFNPKVILSKDRVKECIPMSALSTSAMTLDSSEFYTTTSNSGSKFQNGDTLLARITPCLENGKTGFVAGIASEEGAVGSTEFIVMRSKQINPYMVYLLARTEDFRKTAIKSMTGSDGRQRAQPDKIKAYMYILPPKRIIDSFADIASSLFEEIQNKSWQNKKLSESRDRLLPKLMSGEIAV